MGSSILQAGAPQISAAKGEPSRPCPACGRTTAHAFRFRVNGCDILQCGECGLGRTQTAAFDPAAYYTEDYFSGRRADGYADYPGAEPVLRREFARSVDFIRRYRSGGKLLELGCAYGFFLKEAARYFDVAGIELAEEAAAHAHRAGLNVLHGAADAANLQRIGKVDVIALFDVIEHLPQPRETLAPRPSQSRRYHRDHDGRFRLAGRAAHRRAMAADDAATASMVLDAGEHAPLVRRARACARASRPSLEDRSGVAHRISAAADARPGRGWRNHGQPDRCSRQ